MKLNITQDKLIREIQIEFKKHFPFLKLELCFVAYAIYSISFNPDALIRGIENINKVEKKRIFINRLKTKINI